MRRPPSASMSLVAAEKTSMNVSPMIDRGVDGYQPDVKPVTERGLDLFPLALSQQPVVHEHAGELVTDRTVDEHSRHRRIDSSRQTEHDSLVSDPGTQRSDLLVNE